MGGMPTGGAELVAVTNGTWPSVGVGLLGSSFVWTDAIVAIDDCEFDRAGLPGRTENSGAGDGWDGDGAAGDALVRDGEAVAVGVGRGVLLFDEVLDADSGTGVGFDSVGRGPV